MPAPRIDPDALELGRWLHGILTDAFGMDTETWSVELAQSAMDHVNLARLRRPKLKAVVLWLNQPIAFTAPGEYVYVSRRLLERVAEPGVALVLGHEAAHHDLGHLDTFAGWAAKLPRVGGSKLVARAFRMVESRLYSQDHELDADRLGLELCLAAGYPGEQCLDALRHLQQYALDQGAIDAVYGTDDGGGLNLPELDAAVMKARAWLTEKTHSHPPLHRRLELLQEQLATEAAGSRPPRPRRSKPVRRT